MPIMLPDRILAKDQGHCHSLISSVRGSFPSSIDAPITVHQGLSIEIEYRQCVQFHRVAHGYQCVHYPIAQFSGGSKEQG